MVGVRTLMTIELLNVANEDIIDEGDIMTVKENVMKLPKSIAETILKEHGGSDLDYVDIQLQGIEYLEQEDLEELLSN